MRALAIAVLLFPAVPAAAPLVDSIVPGLFPVGASVPGSAFAGSVDEWGVRVEAGRLVEAVLSWSGDASLALGLDRPGACLEQLCLHRLADANPPAACPEAEGSLVTGAREVRLAWTAPADAHVGFVVHPGLVREETPYALAVTVDGAPADARLDVDDGALVAWPWVAACRV